MGNKFKEMKMNYIYNRSKPLRFTKTLEVYGLILLLFLFTTCKKEIEKSEASVSSIKYFDGGSKDKVNTIEKTSDGGFIYCGYTGADSARIDAFLLKVDGNGNQQWYKTFGGDNYDEFRHVIQTSDGGFIAVGQTNSIGTGSTDGTYKICDYVVKLNSGGNVEWTKSYVLYPCCLTHVAETPDHNFMITGFTSPSTLDAILLKIDASGNIIYGRSYPSLSSYPPFNITNNYNEFGQCVSFANDGSVIVGGVMSKSNFVTEAQSHVTFLMKVNSSGVPSFFYPMYDYVRGNNYSTAYGNPQRRLATVKIINLADGYLIGTYTEDRTSPILKMQLLKTNLSGEVQWHKEYSGLGNALLYNMEANADGSIMLIGASSSGPMILSYTRFPELFYDLKTMMLKVDKDGNELWATYNGSEVNATMAKCVQPMPEGGWKVAGYTCLNETGYDKMCWMKVDSEGKLLVK